MQTYEYDSFGKLKDLKNRIKQPYAFTGREFDRETGQYFYRARYYDAEVGRFTQKDSLGCGTLDTNLYRYVDSNPVNTIDPSGQIDVSLTWPEIAPLVPAIPLIINPVTVGIGIGAGILLYPSEIADESDMCPDDADRNSRLCETWFDLCLRNPWQPAWNQRNYGKRKDCRSCRIRCLNNNGNWPFNMCPA